MRRSSPWNSHRPHDLLLRARPDHCRPAHFAGRRPGHRPRDPAARHANPTRGRPVMRFDQFTRAEILFLRDVVNYYRAETESRDDPEGHEIGRRLAEEMRKTLPPRTDRES